MKELLKELVCEEPPGLVPLHSAHLLDVDYVASLKTIVPYSEEVLRIVASASFNWLHSNLEKRASLRRTSILPLYLSAVIRSCIWAEREGLNPAGP